VFFTRDYPLTTLWYQKISQETPSQAERIPLVWRWERGSINTTEDCQSVSPIKIRRQGERPANHIQNDFTSGSALTNFLPQQWQH